MKKIDISTPKHPNTFAMVDDEDYPWLVAYPWRATNNNGRLYVVRGDCGRVVSMHREILGTPADMHTDHLDGNGLNNTRCNLRKCSHSENQSNRGKQRNNTSGFKGVYWTGGRRNRWRAELICHRKRFRSGYFFCITKAAKAYDKLAKQYHGEFACLNFPEE